MMHFFQEIAYKFEELKDDLFQAANKATSAVGNAVSFTEGELKDAEASVFGSLEATELTLSQAFAEGAKWAAARVSVSVAQPPVVGNEAGQTPVIAGDSTANTSGAAAPSVQS